VDISGNFTTKDRKVCKQAPPEPCDLQVDLLRLTQPIAGLEAQIFALYIQNNPTQGNLARVIMIA